jgi:hypothetical protein
MWLFLRRLFCFHHDYGITAEPGSIFMRCRKCGHRTAGWNIDVNEVITRTTPPRQTDENQQTSPALGLPMRRRAVRDA